MKNFHLPLSLLSLLVVNLTQHSIYGAAIENLYQNDSRTFENDRVGLAKRSCDGKDQKLFRKESGTCSYYPVKRNTTNRWAGVGLDLRPIGPEKPNDASKSTFPPYDAMVMTSSMLFDPHNDTLNIRRICRNIQILKEGIYLIALRCDPSVKKTTVYVKRPENQNLRPLPLKCFTRENKVTTSMIVHYQQRLNVLMTYFQASPTAEMTEISVVFVAERLPPPTWARIVTNRLRLPNGKRSLCDLVNPKTECQPSLLNYLSPPAQSLTSQSKRDSSMDPVCVGIQLLKVGVYWVILNVDGLEPGVGNYTLRLYNGWKKPIDLLTVETYRQYVSHSMAFFNNDQSNILKVEDANHINCRRNRGRRFNRFFRTRMIPLIKNTQRLHVTFTNTKTYVLETTDDLRFNSHVPTYPTSLVPRPLDVEGANWWYDVFNADLAGRYVISLRVLSEDNVTFNLAHLNSGCDEYVSSDMYFYFQRLASAQSFVLYMEQNARFKIQLTNIDDDLYGTEILKGSTFAIAWVNELYDK